MQATDNLVIEYCGETYAVSSADSFTFGRTGDLAIDDNPYMHRIVGRFRYDADRWWMDNVGSRSIVEYFNRETRAKSAVMPGTDQVLPGGEIVVRFAAGTTTYEFNVRAPELRGPALNSEVEAAPTVPVQAIPMTESQLLLVLALAEPMLRDPLSRAAVPHTKEAASRLGWAVKKFNRKLDNVCTKFANTGVSGLKSKSGGLARDRRQRLVEHCVATGVVTEDMLELLDQQHG